jgi:HEAT repeat protein
LSAAADDNLEKEKRLSRALAVVAGLWVACLLTFPTLTAARWCFAVTAGLILVNFIFSLWRLIDSGRVLILVNLAQLPLFCLLNYQLFRAFGESHYRWDEPPFLWDWVELTAVHALRAIDILDGLEAYGIDLQNVEHNSTAAGLLLVWMHIAIDVFLIGLIVRWVGRLWKNVQWRESERYARFLKWSRRIGVTVCILLIVGCGLAQTWRFGDWFLWPLDNILRAADIGDMFQIFNWRLHGVEMGFGTITLAVSLRLVAAIALAEWINRWRLQHFAGLGATVDELAEAVGSSDQMVRVAAVKALLRLGASGEVFGRIGSPAVPALIDILKSQDRNERRAAIEALAGIGSAAAPALVMVLKSGDLVECSRATEALSRIGSGAVPELIKAIESAGMDDQLSAEAEALGKIGAEAEAAVPALIGVLIKSGYVDELRAVAEALGRIGPKAAPALTKLLKSGETFDVGAAVEAVGRIGPAAKAAVPSLIDVLRSTDDCDSLAAAEALGRMGQASVPALIKVLNSGSVYERSRAAAAFELMGPAAEAAVPALDRLLKSLHDNERDSAAAALGWIGPAAKAAVPELINLLNSGDVFAQSAAVEALGKIGPAAVPALIDVLKSGGDDSREAAAEALGTIAPANREVMVALRDVARDRKQSPLVRKEASEAWKRIKERAGGNR